ncbi:T9SS type A sorting domain-containing protein [Ignavibacterium sp.]|uniref:T9SS type A sorting domain-containing protein n=1 Tax=Ignavibacterium sp. TaxID=2651167 RepID=UPI00307D410F
MNLRSVLVLFFCFGFLLNSKAQWQSDIRLTNDPASSVLSSYNKWCVASSSSGVHVVWRDNRTGYWQIYYKVSSDGGVNWEPDIRLTDDILADFQPSIAVSGNVVHVVWYDETSEVYYKRSPNAGLSWEPEIKLSDTTQVWGSAWHPSISSTGSTVIAAWQENLDGNWDVYYKRSTDGGLSWLPTGRIITPNSSENASVSISGTNVLITWMEGLPVVGYEIFSSVSSNEGINWSAATPITNDSIWSGYPSPAISGNVLHITWQQQLAPGIFEVYYTRSSGGGNSWESARQLNSNSSSATNPSIVASGNLVYVVWSDFRDFNYEIYGKSSANEGVSWEEDIRLTNDPSYSLSPSISLFDSAMHIVWNDGRDGNPEIYYKKNSTGGTVSIENDNSELPNNFSLTQNYPNPFNPSTKISWQSPVSAHQTLKVFDVFGNEVATLVDEYKPAGSYEVEFNAKALSSGIYFYKLQASSFTETKKMIYLK